MSMPRMVTWDRSDASPSGQTITIDTENHQVLVKTDRGIATYAIGSPEAFAIISNIWLRSGWDNKYVYSFTWLGRAIIQLPEDLIRIQEVVYSVRPDVIIETGVAHGGSLIFYATLCKAVDKGRVIGIDIDIRAANRKAIESHQLSPFITLIDGDSVDPAVVERVAVCLQPGETVLVLLDSRHTKEHVLAELNAYAPFVSPGSYIVAMDGIMEYVVGAPRTLPDWSWNNPRQAAREWVDAHPDFRIEEPPPLFNEGSPLERVTYWPGGFIKRLK
jgi:cephalosporin hydroxylase